MVRPATEEFNLAANAHHHDVTNAEFLRTYRSADFFVGQLARRLQMEEQAQSASFLPFNASQYAKEMSKTATS